MKLDKIRVLLIDDEPNHLTRRRTLEGRSYAVPALGPEAGMPGGIPRIDDLFELRWLATVEETREFRDLSGLLAAKQPRALGEDGWVPEILCFDYQMTLGPGAVEDRFPEPLARDLSPLPDLREVADRQGVRRHPVKTSTFEPGRGNDSYGCYCGGLIFTLFADHPCAPVALTRYHNVTMGTDAAFFEWFLELDGGEAFKRKGKPVLSWQALLEEGVERLRRRVLALVGTNLVDLDLNLLMALAAGEERDGLLVNDRFGSRYLPIAGLFCDIAEPLRRGVVMDWATQCLEVLFSGLQQNGTPSAFGNSSSPSKALDEFREARDFCEVLWQEYLSDRSVRRYRLSELAHLRKQGPLAQGDEAELRRLCKEFDVDITRLDGKQDPPCSRYLDLRSRPKASQRTLRWTALLIAVRLELWAAACQEAWRNHHHKRGIDGIFDLVLTKVEPNDVFLALFPVPKNPLVTGFHDGRAISSSWNRFLKPKAASCEESLALDLKDLLDREPWVRSDQEHGCAPCGLLPGEAQVLRWFAQSESGFRDSLLGEIEWLKGRG